MKLTIEDIVADFIKRFKWDGQKDDYYISIADTSMLRKEDVILDGKALLYDVIDNLMEEAKAAKPKSSGGYEVLSKLGGLVPGSGAQTQAGITTIGSLYGMKHDLAKYKILKNVRFMINKRVDFKAKVNFLFRVYVQGKDSNVTYTTIDLDNLMKVRDVFNIALRKFGIFPQEGVRHDLILCEKEPNGSKSPILSFKMCIYIYLYVC